MKTLFFVLWLYQPVPWGFHGISLSEGWFSRYTFSGESAYADCMVVKEISKYQALCLRVGDEPIGKISEVINVK